jgi:hypothetical protein
VLVTGYDFVQDSATMMKSLFENDFGNSTVVDAQLIGPLWAGNLLRQKQLHETTRFDIQAINGHSTHTATGTPDNNDVLASQVVNATANLGGALVYAVGCHSGLNVPGELDLAQAFVRRGANYVGNTGFGWGGSGIVYSEALMRNYTRELLRDGSAQIGPSLMAAKQKYRQQAFIFNAYDAKILMQSTLYGLPMAEVTSGATLSGEEPFPSATTSVKPPTSFGETNVGSFGYGLSNSFGSFGSSSTGEGTIMDLDKNTYFAAGAPIQPHFYADLNAPLAGELRGVIFRGGVYSDVVNFNPVVALPLNEYITDATPQAFSEPGWFPPQPFVLQNSASISNTAETLVLSLGQFDSSTRTQRVYDRMALDTFYSRSADRTPPEILFVDGVLNSAAGRGEIKVETYDDSGVKEVVVAFTDNPLSGQGEWKSINLAFDTGSQKWTGVITGTVRTRYFVQVADKAGNVAVSDNKGAYHSLLPPLPLVQGRPLNNPAIYLPVIRRD